MDLSSYHCLYCLLSCIPRALVYCPWGRVSYTFSSFRCVSPSCMYCCVSITTTQELVSACLMVME